MRSTAAVKSLFRGGRNVVRNEEVTTSEEATSILQLHVMSQDFRPEVIFLIALNAVLSIEGSAQRRGVQPEETYYGRWRSEANLLSGTRT
jgi:hypothetical protein